MPGHGLRSDAWFAARRLGFLGRVPREMLVRGLSERERLVDDSMDACIDGFPRSANTLAYHAFVRANPGVRVAHHLHTPIQVVRAVELGVPCAVTIRAPLEAISSFLVFRAAIEPGAETVAGAVRRYIDFYERVAEVRDEVVVCSFERIVADPAVVARELNNRFGSGFSAPALGPDGKAELIAAIERRHRLRGRELGTYTMPRAERAKLKAAVRPAVRDHPSLRYAQAAYARLVAPERAPHGGVEA